MRLVLIKLDIGGRFAIRKLIRKVDMPQADEMLDVEEIKVTPRVAPLPQTR